MMLRVAHLPLRGTRVLDVTTSIAGPYCAQILATLGADVIKVERPDTGDDARAWGPPFWDGEGTMFLSANAGKRSLGITLRDPDGREAVLRLAERSDVFLQSLRPGHADALGIGPDVVRARNPRVVYCSIGAYGRVGPLSREPGYDALMQAAGGLISVTGEPGRPGVGAAEAFRQRRSTTRRERYSSRRRSRRAVGTVPATHEATCSRLTGCAPTGTSGPGSERHPASRRTR